MGDAWERGTQREDGYRWVDAVADALPPRFMVLDANLLDENTVDLKTCLPVSVDAYRKLANTSAPTNRRAQP